MSGPALRISIALLLALATAGCGTSEFVRKVNETWRPSIERGTRLVTADMIEDCRARIFERTKKTEEVSPLTTDINLTKLVVNQRYLFLLMKEDLQPGDIFVLVGRFKYLNWGLPGEGRWGCSWKMVGDTATFIDVLGPTDFKIRI